MIYLLAAISTLLGVVIGLLVGWKARDIHAKLDSVYGLWRDRIETPAGVVQPPRRRVTRGQQPPSLPGSNSGVVMRPRPNEVKSDDPNVAYNLEQQNRALRGN
jgi:hypothetical protein